jgi:shikimate kinase
MAEQVFLVGYMAAGKTSAALALSQQSGLPMIDLDEEFERREGRTIPEVFQQDGEAAFRSKESALLREVAGQTKFAIVACGGGAMINPQNVQTMRDHGLIVWIDPPLETILERLRANPGDRPLLQAMGFPSNEDQLRAHYEDRRAGYAQSDERIEDLSEPVLTALVARISREG